MSHVSRYATKLHRRNQAYGPGKPGSCCAHKLEYVEIHVGRVTVGNREYKSISRVPSDRLPIFTTERTRRVA